LAGSSSRTSRVIGAGLADEGAVLGASGCLEGALRLDGGASRHVRGAAHLEHASALRRAEVARNALNLHALLVRHAAVSWVTLVSAVGQEPDV